MFHQQPRAVYLYALLLGQLVAYAYGSLNILLESPFLASIFWLIAGVEMGVMSLLQASRQTVSTGAVGPQTG
jgi:hypothetical protein